MLALLFAINVAGAPAAAPRRRRLLCTLSDNGLSYGCHRGEQVVMVGAPIAVHLDGAWHVAGRSLRLHHAEALQGSDAVGSYSGRAIHWLAGPAAVPFTTAVRNYAPPSAAVVFEYGLPGGANRTAHTPTADPVFPWRTAYSTIANFPAMAQVAPRRALSWKDAFITPQLDLAAGPNAGVTVLMDEASGDAEVLVASPLNHFIGSSTGNTLASGQPAAWSLGLESTIESLPAGFSHALVLWSGVGVTQTMHDWGSLLLRLANTSKIADPTLRGLSYQTDNGAQYCFCNEGCDRKLLAVRRGLEESGVPVQLMSFQGGWWKNPNIHTAACAPWCVTSWAANRTKVPMGLPAFAQALGLPLQLYAPYFCNDTVYDEANGQPEGRWPFSAADESLPGCDGYVFKNVAPEAAESFYEYFLSEGKKGGMGEPSMEDLPACRCGCLAQSRHLLPGGLTQLPSSQISCSRTTSACRRTGGSSEQWQNGSRACRLQR
jgi:hypothetical protein